MSLEKDKVLLHMVPLQMLYGAMYVAIATEIYICDLAYKETTLVYTCMVQMA